MPVVYFSAVCSLSIQESPFHVLSFQVSTAGEIRRLFWATPPPTPPSPHDLQHCCQAVQESFLPQWGGCGEMRDAVQDFKIKTCY